MPATRSASAPSDHTAATPSRKRPFLFHMQRNRFITEKKKSSTSQENQGGPGEKPSSEERPKMGCPKAQVFLHSLLEEGPCCLDSCEVPRKGHSELGQDASGTVTAWFLGQPVPSVQLPPGSPHLLRTGDSYCVAAFLRAGRAPALQLAARPPPPPGTLWSGYPETGPPATAGGTPRHGAPPPPGAPAHTKPGICARRKGTEAAAGKAASG